MTNKEIEVLLEWLKEAARDPKGFTPKAKALMIKKAAEAIEQLLKQK